MKKKGLVINMKAPITILQHNIKHYTESARAFRTDATKLMEKAEEAEKFAAEYQAAVDILTKK